MSATFPLPPSGSPHFSITATAKSWSPSAQKKKRLISLGIILLLHIALFLALKNGLVQQVTLAIPQQIVTVFIAPQAASQPSKPKVVTPKAVPVAKKNSAPPPPIPVPAASRTPAPPIAAPVAETESQHEDVSEVATETAIPAASPAATVAAPTPRTITSGIEYIQEPRPEYPSSSKRMGEEGKVIMRVLINEKGRAERIEIQKTSGYSRLDDAAKRAMLRALFKPYMENGKAIPVYAIVPINFQLSN
ncbi:energy transducer TonB [Glaciimonas soli]|uniref:TonB family protein n=1 Tax=Glaciimonas soli TaxID=2590999 RepID=A0A843YWU2_9BURK|nr:energy transducer TonB [Glaciimonas soli]MQR02183.1 TonB family protein [Glaciimonas soli]